MKIFPQACLTAALALICATGCYRGGARPVELSALAHDKDWVTLPRVPVLIQDGEHECGAAATAMVLNYWDVATTADQVRAASKISTEHGITAGYLRTYIRSRGLQAYLIEGTFDDLERELKAGRPVMVGVQRKFTTGLYDHYQVVVGIDRTAQQLAVIDPAEGYREYSFSDFTSEWAAAKSLTLVVSRPAIGPEGK
jgi:ABC-type bacteriocin/lantibiotic exporter with double-glycine peptidase domain